MISGVTHLGGLAGLPGRVTLSAGVTIRHVKVSRWGNPPNRGRFRGKKLKAKHVCYKTFYISEPSHGRNYQKPQRTHKESKMFTFRNISRRKSTIF